MYYFLSIPEIPKKFSHQRNDVELIEYLVKEGEKIQSDQPVAVVKNWWAEFQIKATTKGVISKIFFSPGTRILIGKPIAIIICDGEDAPAGKPESKLEVFKILRERTD